jgi:methionyl-tRNA synthetase
LKDYELIEYEETILAPLVSTNANEALALAESVIGKANLDTEPPSPAEIIIFSALHNAASTAKVDTHPALFVWFAKVADTAWAKAGTEKATSLTTVKLLKISAKARKKTLAAEELGERMSIKNIKAGVEMKVPKAGQDM